MLTNAFMLRFIHMIFFPSVTTSCRRLVINHTTSDWKKTSWRGRRRRQARYSFSFDQICCFFCDRTWHVFCYWLVVATPDPASAIVRQWGSSIRKTSCGEIFERNSQQQHQKTTQSTEPARQNTELLFTLFDIRWEVYLHFYRILSTSFLLKRVLQNFSCFYRVLPICGTEMGACTTFFLFNVCVAASCRGWFPAKGKNPTKADVVHFMIFLSLKFLFRCWKMLHDLSSLFSDLESTDVPKMFFCRNFVSCRWHNAKPRKEPVTPIKSWFNSVKLCKSL